MNSAASDPEGERRLREAIYGADARTVRAGFPVSYFDTPLLPTRLTKGSVQLPAHAVRRIRPGRGVR